jgi:hypothetical protein
MYHIFKPKLQLHILKTVVHTITTERTALANTAVLLLRCSDLFLGTLDLLTKTNKVVVFSDSRSSKSQRVAWKFLWLDKQLPLSTLFPFLSPWPAGSSESELGDAVLTSRDIIVAMKTLAKFHARLISFSGSMLNNELIT